MTWLDDLAEKALARELPARAEALEVLRSGEGAQQQTLPEHRRDLVRVRRRGAGTTLPANA